QQVIVGRCICSPPTTYYKASEQRCVAVSPAAGCGDPKNNGCQKPDCGAGDPINPAMGNNWREESDFSAKQPGSTFSFSRIYNSNVFSVNSGVAHSFGTNWTQPFGNQAIQISNPQATPPTPTCYTWNDDQTFAFCQPQASSLSATFDG